METRYIVDGMTCQHCVSHVTEEVSAIEGVDHVNVDLESGQMVVTSQSPISLGLIEDAVDEAGDYSVTTA
ncbi:MAG: heavy-metal-associated domain-containing protein [Propionibacteriaceae bacterium]|jgi:copper ion binding protein|nr:heavy-metal-associated domain-containing protein [Propionibacteriaceae bacterium]